MPQTVFIVEDHPVMRKGYAALIDAELDLDICGETGSAAEARRRIAELNPDLVIVGLSVEEGSGLELIKALRSARPNLPVLVISMRDEALYAERAIRAGAKGYIMKSEAEPEVVRAIRHVLKGGIFLSEAVNTQIMLRLCGVPSVDSDAGIGTLSDRELEVFEGVGQGLTTREVAEQLALSPKTIATYRTRIKEKLEIDSNAQLRRRAVVWMQNLER